MPCTAVKYSSTVFLFFLLFSDENTWDVCFIFLIDERLLEFVVTSLRDRRITDHFLSKKRFNVSVWCWKIRAIWRDFRCKYSRFRFYRERVSSKIDLPACQTWLILFYCRKPPEKRVNQDCPADKSLRSERQAPGFFVKNVYAILVVLVSARVRNFNMMEFSSRGGKLNLYLP